MVGARRLLLVHGFGGSRDDFTEWLPAFAALGWDAAAPELPPTLRSLDDVADCILATADGLGWDRFVLFGHSMGGMAAQRVALRAEAGADRLDALVLMGTTHGPIPVERGTVELGKAIVRDGGMAALVEAQRDRPRPPAMERLLRERPGYREFMERKALAMDPDMWLALVDDMLDQPDRLDALRSVALATLVVVGEQDDFRTDNERIAAAMPNARLVVVPDAAHSPQFEAPDAWWQAVSSFLEEVS